MDEETLTVWLDTALLMLGSFVLLAVLMMTIVNPEARETDASMAQPGNVVVEITWQDSLDADVDLWVQAPGDVPVGYSNKSGRVFNLLRDDLGRAQDMSDLNFEVAYSRGRPPGEYTVNLHMYRGIGVAYPVYVAVKVSLQEFGAGKAPRVVTSKTARLERENQEITVTRFSLDAAGQFIGEHDLPKGLRSASSQ